VFQVVRCRDCGHRYLNPRPVEAELSRIYPSHYYAYNYDKAVHPLALRAKAWLDGGKVNDWLKHSLQKQASAKKTLRFLDVGCGNGRYLQQLHRMGFAKHQLFGVEMDEGAIARLNQAGFQGYYGRIEAVASELPENSFDLIVMLQVIEHVAQPAQIVQILTKLLRPGGRLILETPNLEGWDARLFQSGFWGGYHFPRHWHFFDRTTLQRLLCDNGLESLQFRALPSHAFWILSYRHWLQHQVRWQNLAQQFDPLQNIPLLSVFTSFDLVRAKLGFWTSNLQAVAVKPQSGKSLQPLSLTAEPPENPPSG
jgi:2-polyprenyl-3-methyl-5-hydroxy-6-metoxy-1,4-benzoquinol methylase